jgi:hypothetical protein
MAIIKNELEQLKGIGGVLAKRLKEEGVDSFAKVVEAGEEGLRKIRGINPRAISSILEQAALLADTAKTGRAERVEEVKKMIGGVRDKVQALAASTKERFQEELAGKYGKKLTSDLVRLVDALDKFEDSVPKRLKRAGKGLAKAEKKVEGLAEAGLKKVRKGLKKTRKSLVKVLG